MLNITYLERQYIKMSSATISTANLVITYQKSKEDKKTPLCIQQVPQ